MHQNLLLAQKRHRTGRRGGGKIQSIMTSGTNRMRKARNTRPFKQLLKNRLHQQASRT
jgi:hypothetical protein